MLTESFPKLTKFRASILNNQLDDDLLRILTTNCPHLNHIYLQSDGPLLVSAKGIETVVNNLCQLEVFVVNSKWPARTPDYDDDEGIIPKFFKKFGHSLTEVALGLGGYDSSSNYLINIERHCPNIVSLRVGAPGHLARIFQNCRKIAHLILDGNISIEENIPFHLCVPLIELNIAFCNEENTIKWIEALSRLHHIHLESLTIKLFDHDIILQYIASQANSLKRLAVMEGQLIAAKLNDICPKLERLTFHSRTSIARKFYLEHLQYLQVTGVDEPTIYTFLSECGKSLKFFCCEHEDMTIIEHFCPQLYKIAPNVWKHSSILRP
jgi:hypothetical protein